MRRLRPARWPTSDCGWCAPGSERSVIYFPDRSASDNEAFAAFLGEIRNHLVFVLRERFQWTEIATPELSFGTGHVLVRFENEGRRLVFRVPQFGLAQLKCTMLAYRHVGHLGMM